MWILECDGDILEDKRIWLRPGKSYLFGRTKPEGGRYAGFRINHKSVSRKHMTLSVAAVKPGYANLPDVRSELSLKDEGTKVGTVIDNIKVHGKTQVLSGNEHTFQLGGYEQLFRIKWHSVVLTFTFPSKETKGGKDPLIPIRSRLEDLDIKTVIPYVIGKTTHVVAGKRNTAKCLQALVNAIHIVDNSFLDAIVYSTTPGNLDEPESLSPLEEDFDKNWPNAFDYLPGPGKEPGQRPKEMFTPDTSRKDVFEGFTFVFCDARQFDTLQPPITNAGGKAVFFEIKTNKTSVKEVCEYMQKTSAAAHAGDDSKVILVRFEGDKGHEEWAANLQREISITRGRQLVQQNEFLDAILMNDVGKLQRLLPEPELGSPPPPNGTSAHLTEGPTEQPSIEDEDVVPAKALRRGRTRGAVKSVFSGIDDGFDPSQVIASRRSASVTSQSRRTHHSRLQHGKQDDVIMEEGASGSSSPNVRKRPAENELAVDDLLPAAAAMKRRRLEEAEQRSRGVSSTATAKEQPKDATKKRKKKEVDIQEVVRERRKAEETKALEDEESLHQTLEGMSVDDMKKLAVIEEMEVPERKALADRSNDHDDRWDPRWNGRKNFKKFRRQGEGGQPRRGPTVIVPLEEVKKRGQGVSRSYVHENSTSSSRHQNSPTERDRSRSGQEQEREQQLSRSESYASARSQHHEEAVPAELTIGGTQEIIDVDAPRTTRLHDKSGNDSQRMNKRAAPTASGRTASKRQKTLALREESDSEDELKFRFRKTR